MNLNEVRFNAAAAFKRSNKIETVQRGMLTRNDRRARFSETDSTSDMAKLKACSSTNTTTNTTTDVTSDSSGVILAITEGRGEATYEVGIAAINQIQSELTLVQISDSQDYFKVLRKINVLNPAEILVPKTIVSSRLVEMLKKHFGSVTINSAPRGFFNKEAGLMQVQKLCAPAWNSVFLVVQQKYYALTATGALMAYMESYKHVYCAHNSLKVDYQESDYNMVIDVCVADKLELVSCAFPEAHQAKYSSLRGILNNCVTKIGNRNLRATILQPPSNLEEIENRLNVVEYFYKNPQKLDLFQEILKLLARIDQILSLGTFLNDNSQAAAVRHLNYVLQLNVFFNIFDELKSLVAKSKLVFFMKLQEILEHPDLLYLKNLFKKTIDPDIKPAVGTKAVLERCYAVKMGVNEFLDILRKKLAENQEDIKIHVEDLQKKYGLPIQLNNNTTQGYHIIMKLPRGQMKSFKESSLPQEFVYINKTNTQITMKTIVLISLSQRLEDIEREVMVTSKVLVSNLLKEVQQRIAVFYNLCEMIAKLDMLQSFAKSAGANGHYVRPQFGDKINVKNSKHPLLNILRESEPTANNILCNRTSKMHIITGPNGSGKSIYIRQIALLQVMAQIGSFVPAEEATFRVCDRLLARISFDDNMECGASTFVVEMKDIQHFFNAITDNTLIIMDELCRSTSTEEGTALAMAICEHLMTTNAFVFLATHFTFIVKLKELYVNVRCWQMETKEELRPNSGHPRLAHTYKVIPGVTSLESYALTLTRAQWPSSIMDDVDNIIHDVPDGFMENAVDKCMRAKLDLENELLHLKDEGKCTLDKVSLKLVEFQKKADEFGNINRVISNTSNTNHSQEIPTIESVLNQNVTRIEEDSNDSTDQQMINMDDTSLNQTLKSCRNLENHSKSTYSDSNKDLSLNKEKCASENSRTKSVDKIHPNTARNNIFNATSDTTLQSTVLRFSKEDIPNNPNKGMSLNKEKCASENSRTKSVDKFHPNTARNNIFNATRDTTLQSTVLRFSKEDIPNNSNKDTSLNKEKCASENSRNKSVDKIHSNTARNNIFNATRDLTLQSTVLRFSKEDIPNNANKVRIMNDWKVSNVQDNPRIEKCLNSSAKRMENLLSKSITNISNTFQNVQGENVAKIPSGNTIDSPKETKKSSTESSSARRFPCFISEIASSSSCFAVVNLRRDVCSPAVNIPSQPLTLNSNSSSMISKGGREHSFKFGRNCIPSPSVHSVENEIPDFLQEVVDQNLNYKDCNSLNITKQMENIFASNGNIVLDKDFSLSCSINESLDFFDKIAQKKSVFGQDPPFCNASNWDNCTKENNSRKEQSFSDCFGDPNAVGHFTQNFLEVELSEGNKTLLSKEINLHNSNAENNHQENNLRNFSFQKSDISKDTSIVNSQIFNGGIRPVNASTPRTTGKLSLKKNANNSQSKHEEPINEESFSYSPIENALNFPSEQSQHHHFDEGLHNVTNDNIPSTSRDFLSEKRKIKSFKLPHKPLNQMSRRQIKDSLAIERQKIMSNNSDLNECAEKILRLPTVDQLKDSKVVCTMKRTPSGLVMIGPPKKKRRFQPPFKQLEKSVPFDCTLFSDARAAEFEEFIKSSSKK